MDGRNARVESSLVSVNIINDALDDVDTSFPGIFSSFAAISSISLTDVDVEWIL